MEKVKSEIVKLNDGRFSVRLEVNEPGGRIGNDYFGSNSTSKPFKTFKQEKRAKTCKRNLDKISNNKKYAWLVLAKKPTLKC